MVDTAIKVIFNDEIIEQLIDLVMDAQQKENTRLPVLKDQLRDTEKRLANLLEAIEQGILTPTTKQRLDELEARKEALNTSILEEELKKPVLTREWIRFWLERNSARVTWAARNTSGVNSVLHRCLTTETRCSVWAERIFGTIRKYLMSMPMHCFRLHTMISLQLQRVQ